MYSSVYRVYVSVSSMLPTFDPTPSSIDNDTLYMYGERGVFPRKNS